MKPTVLALDLEGTLISNAVTQFPRPGLYVFLESCRALFPRVVIYTTVGEEQFRAIASLLVAEGTAPAWFHSMEYVRWSGPTKDLTFIPSVAVHEALLVDDCAAYVHPGQEAQWVAIDQFASPYPEDDTGLASTLEHLSLATDQSRGPPRAKG